MGGDAGRTATAGESEQKPRPLLEQRAGASFRLCGRIIPLADFKEGGGATRYLLEPDSDLSVQKYDTLCRDHSQRD